MSPFKLGLYTVALYVLDEVMTSIKAESDQVQDQLDAMNSEKSLVAMGMFHLMRMLAELSEEDERMIASLER